MGNPHHFKWSMIFIGPFILGLYECSGFLVEYHAHNEKLVTIYVPNLPYYLSTFAEFCHIPRKIAKIRKGCTSRPVTKYARRMMKSTGPSIRYQKSN